MPTPTDKSTQVPSTHGSRSANDAATTIKATGTSKQQTSSPGTDGTQEEIRHWRKVALLTEGWGREIRSGDSSFVGEFKDQITAEETVFNNKAKKRPESGVAVRTMITCSWMKLLTNTDQEPKRGRLIWGFGFRLVSPICT
jgi:hypothetical protein